MVRGLSVVCAPNHTTDSHVKMGATRDYRVEVKGLEPSASTLRTSGSRRYDQVLSEDFPASSVSIPSGSITIPPLPSR